MNDDLLKALQQQLDEAKEQTKIITDDLDAAIQKAKNNIGKPKKDPIQEIINEQNKKK